MAHRLSHLIRAVFAALFFAAFFAAVFAIISSIACCCLSQHGRTTTISVVPFSSPYAPSSDHPDLAHARATAAAITAAVSTTLTAQDAAVPVEVWPGFGGQFPGSL